MEIMFAYIYHSVCFCAVILENSLAILNVNLQNYCHFGVIKKGVHPLPVSPLIQGASDEQLFSAKF